ncbi:MAG TPA: aminotransferase class IV [Thermoleophilaceae bacterium]|nr:aminotransferase class IV [Thermoleophilaceae bacterium]
MTTPVERPDPARGVFTTILVRGGAVVDFGAHLDRLERSVRELYGRTLPREFEEWITVGASELPLGRLRVLVAAGRRRPAAVEIDAHPLDREPEAEPARLAPAYLRGGLGPHKWRDRRLVEKLERSAGALPLIVDLDGEVLEAATANVLIVEGTALITPPLDGRLLPGTVRARALAAASAAGLEPREEPVPLERLEAADEVLLSSAIAGVRPATLAGPAPFAVGAQLRRALREPDLVEVR